MADRLLIPNGPNNVRKPTAAAGLQSRPQPSHRETAEAPPIRGVDLTAAPNDLLSFGQRLSRAADTHKEL